MKRLFTLFYAMLLGAVPLMAQGNRIFEFVDGAGKTIDNGKTVSVAKIEEFVPGVPEAGMTMPADISVRNISGEKQNVVIVGTIKKLKGEAIEICFPTSCKMWDKVATFPSEEGEVSADKKVTKSLEMKFNLGAETQGKGVCTIKLQLFTVKKKGDKLVKDKMGPYITVNFDEALALGINDVSYGKAVSYDVYNLQGVLIGKNLTSLQDLSKGTYVVKTVDNKGGVTTKKFVVR